MLKEIISPSSEMSHNSTFIDLMENILEYNILNEKRFEEKNFY